jgi:hypothetical protein
MVEETVEQNRRDFYHIRGLLRRLKSQIHPSAVANHSQGIGKGGQGLGLPGGVTDGQVMMVTTHVVRQGDNRTAGLSQR